MANFSPLEQESVVKLLWGYASIKNNSDIFLTRRILHFVRKRSCLFTAPPNKQINKNMDKKKFVADFSPKDNANVKGASDGYRI